MQPVDRQRRRKITIGSLAGTNLQRAGDHNQRVTLQAIRTKGPLTRVELARLTGLTTPAIANIINRLLRDNLIVELGRVRGRRGQPAMRLAINPEGCFSIGVSIDRDHITVVALDFVGTVRARATQEMDYPAPDAVIAFCRKAIDGMLKGKQIARERMMGLGVALPSDLGQAQMARKPMSHATWDSLEVPRLFADVASMPVYVENDAIAAAIGELQFGLGLRCSSFYYVLIGAALRGALVIEGDVHRGAGQGGALGIIPLRSRRTSARTLQEAVSLPSLYAVLAANGHKIFRPDQLSALKESSQQALTGWIDAAADFLSEPLVAVNLLINPKSVLIGGRLPSDIIDRLAERLNQKVRKRAGDVLEIAPIARATMSADAPAIGAGALPIIDRLLPSRSALMKATAE